MVIIKFYNNGKEDTVKFLMKTKEKETNLVNKFNLGLVEPKTILNLGVLGKIAVKDIISMKIIENTDTFHVDSIVGPKIDGFEEQFKKVFGKG